MEDNNVDRLDKIIELDGCRGEIVKLEAVAPFAFNSSAWKSERIRQEIPIVEIFGMIHTPTRVQMILYVFPWKAEIFNPLTDCAAVTPTPEALKAFKARHHPDLRALANEAIAVHLTGRNAWPYPEADKPSFIDHVRGTELAGTARIIGLDPNKPTSFNTGEWAKQKTRGDDDIQSYYMVNKRASLGVELLIDAHKEKEPTTIDPFTDCCASFTHPGFLRRTSLRFSGIKTPTDEVIAELGRQAIAVHLESLGVWEMRNNRREQEPLRLLVEELIFKARGLPANNKIETAGHEMLAALDAGVVHPNIAAAMDKVRGLITELDALARDAQEILAEIESDDPPETDRGTAHP